LIKYFQTDYKPKFDNL